MQSPIKPSRLLIAVAALSLAAAAVPGCGGPPGADLCDAEARCELWSPAQANACYAEADDNARFSSAVGCAPALDNLIRCQEATGFCDGGRHWKIMCMPEQDAWHKCSGR